MTPKAFIKQVCRDISEAVSEDSAITGVRGVIDFDIATVAVEEAEAGASVSVLGVGGQFGGNSSTQNTSRVKFSIQLRAAISPSGR